MAVLEAFVYDPLLNWRLIETGNKSKKAKSNTGNAGAPSASGDNVGGVSASEVSQSNADLNPLTGGDQMGKLRYSVPNIDNPFLTVRKGSHIFCKIFQPLLIVVRVNQKIL